MYDYRDEWRGASEEGRRAHYHRISSPAMCILSDVDFCAWLRREIESAAWKIRTCCWVAARSVWDRGLWNGHGIVVRQPKLYAQTNGVNSEQSYIIGNIIADHVYLLFFNIYLLYSNEKFKLRNPLIPSFLLSPMRNMKFLYMKFNTNLTDYFLISGK